MQINEEKKRLREKFRKVRSAAKDNEKDRRISELLLGSLAYKNAETLFIYYSVKSEADTLQIIAAAASDGKRIALPKCTDRSGNMKFYFITDPDETLKEGFFSLKEPDEKLCEKASFGAKDICIVPALACDRRGYRLGYGGGYYDRFLSGFKGKTMALCYEECLCDELPCDRYDRRIDMIITDLKIYELK